MRTLLRESGGNEAWRGLESKAPLGSQRALPTLADACGWHRRIYDGCAVPAAGYVGNFRGDPAHPELADYEVAAEYQARTAFAMGAVLAIALLVLLITFGTSSGPERRQMAPGLTTTRTTLPTPST